ncbi:hypothetical protein [Dactylococcopsis salina]|uniref:hypothetical protein n=1 Tax=Dactylococcopsis salina TaxID=292566 RepID=UPI0002F3ACCA|nr:hypothetical protein [Dactylococcopsis salina]
MSNLPFSPGQQVEIIIIAENPPTENLTSRFKKLLKETQALHEESPLSEEDIQTEIDAYRRGE